MLNAIPLSLRAPNPPLSIQGRGALLDALDRRHEQGAALTILSGAPGAGQERAVGHVDQAAPRRRVVPVARCASNCRAAPSYDSVCAQLARAIGALDAGAEGQGVLLSERADQQLQQVIDLADRHEFFVILDHAQRADDAAIEQLGQQLVRYARTARWFLVSQRAYSSLTPHTLEVEPLAREHLVSIIEQWHT